MRFRSLIRLGCSITNRMSGERNSSSAVKPSNIATQYQEQLFENAAKGNVDEVETLLSAVDIDAKNDRGWTALMFAARNGQVPVIKSLLEKGCNVNILNSSGQTAIDIANFWNQSDVSQALSDKSVPTQETECRNYYSMNPLNRASDRRKDPEWIDNSMRKDNTKFILFSNLNPFLVEEPDSKTKKTRYVLELFSYKQLAAHIAKKPLVVFLGLETWDPDSAAWFAIDVSGAEEEEFKSMNKEGHFGVAFPTTMQMEDRHAGIFAEARSILTWHDRYSFCSTCGSSTTALEAGYKRTCDNTQCRSRNGIHNTCYPRVDPSLIMLVVSPDGSRCLLGRKKSFPPKMYSCLAGFMEPGESIEDTCRREVEEESGVQVGRVEYHSSQPWPFPAVLMLGCITYAKTDTIKLTNDDELEDARWFTRPEIAQILSRKHPEGFFIPPRQAIAHNLIKTWAGRNSNL